MIRYWIQITSGRGPEECCLFVKKLTDYIQKEAKKNNFEIELLEVEKSELNNLKSALLSIEGENINEFEKEWNGTIQWIYESKIRKGHKRKNWFIGVNFIKPIEENKFDLSQLKIETMRSSGAGGQNVNKVESGVRIKHFPTGITVTSQEERSQYLNKKLAFARLFQALQNVDTENKSTFDKEAWNNHNNLIRGNSVKIFSGYNFKLKD